MMMITANGCDEALQNRLSNNSFDDDVEGNDAEDVYIMPFC